MIKQWRTLKILANTGTRLTHFQSLSVMKQWRTLRILRISTRTLRRKNFPSKRKEAYGKDSTSKGKHYGFLLNRVVLCEW